MIVGRSHNEEGAIKYCTTICANNRNTRLMTYYYTLDGVSYNGTLEPTQCVTVCADFDSVTYENGTGTATVSTLCNGLADCTGGDGPSPTPTPVDGGDETTFYTVTWNFTTTSLSNAYIGNSSTSTTSITTINSGAITAGSNATVTVYIIPNTSYVYTLSNQALINVSAGTATNNNIKDGAIPVTLRVTNVQSTQTVNVTVSDANGGAVSTSSGSGSGAGSPNPTPTAVSSGSGSGSGTYYYTVQCVSGGCSVGTTRPTTWVGQALNIGEIVALNNVAGCWEIKSTTTATPISTIVGLCAGVTPTPTPTYNYVVECVSGSCNQGTGRVASSSTSYSFGDIVNLDNVGGCWEVLSTTSVTPVSAITGSCATQTPTPTPAPVYKYLMDPCDGTSPYVVAQSATPKTIGNVYQLSGSLYADQPYTCINTSTASPDTWILDSTTCLGGDGPACLLEGTLVTMHDGTQKKIEDLRIGDTLMSKAVLGEPNMPDSDDPTVLTAWSSPSISLSTMLTQISSVVGYPKTKVTYINSGLLYASDEHLHVVKKGDSWTVAQTTDLQIGDSLINENGEEIVINNINTVYGTFTVYKVNVEQDDVFIANGIVTHNGKGR